MEIPISMERALHLLDRRIEQCGGVRAYARQLGVTAGFVSAAKRTGHITGKMAADVGLQPVYSYLYTPVQPGVLQERYENERRKRQLEVGNPVERNKKMKVK